MIFTHSGNNIEPVLETRTIFYENAPMLFGTIDKKAYNFFTIARNNTYFTSSYVLVINLKYDREKYSRKGNKGSLYPTTRLNIK